jgi:hypothetical protein
MSTESNLENINNMINIPSRRHCSFCKSPNHNILLCNDNRLQDFGNLCYNIYRISPQDFVFWLYDKWITDKNLVKSYSIRFCASTTRSNMNNCVNNIIIRIRETINYESSQSQNTAEVQSPNQEYTQNTPEEGISGTSEPQLPSYLELIYPEFIDGNQLDSVAFISFLMIIGTLRHRNFQSIKNKFNIQTKIVNCCSNLHDKCECNICYENYEKSVFIKLNCGHEFCKECIKQTLKNERTEEPRCAFCRSQFKNFEISSSLINDELKEYIV